MKQLAILVATVSAIMFLSSEDAQAQRFYGHRGSGFAISVGNGFNGFSYSRGIPQYHRWGYARPFYGHGFYNRPVYYGRPVYGGFYGGYRGGFGYGCGRW